MCVDALLMLSYMFVFSNISCKYQNCRQNTYLIYNDENAEQREAEVTVLWLFQFCHLALNLFLQLVDIISAHIHQFLFFPFKNSLETIFCYHMVSIYLIFTRSAMVILSVILLCGTKHLSLLLHLSNIFNSYPFMCSMPLGIVDAAKRTPGAW